MSERIPWNKYEAVILHEAAIRVHTGLEHRKAAIERVSEQLRNMAIYNGIVIDDIYRNTNGISMQLNGMEATIYNLESKLKAHAKIFMVIDELYRYNRENYNLLLQEAKAMIVCVRGTDALDNNNFALEALSIDAFYDWMVSKTTIAPATCKSYASSLRIVCEFAIKNGIIHSRLFEICDNKDLKSCIERIKSNPQFQKYNTEQHNRFSAAINKYFEFRCKNKNSIEHKKDVTSSFEEQESKYLNAVLYILNKKYRYGFRFNSPIEIIRFRQFGEMEDFELPESDELLKNIIIKAGFVFEDRVYIISEETYQELDAIIDSIVNDGNKVIFYNSLYDHYADWMSEHSILSQEVLRELICKSKCHYYVGKNFFTYGEKFTEIEAIVSELKRIWGDALLLTCNTMSTRLPMIPLDKIKHAISCSIDFVWNSEGTYALLDNIIITDYESDAIFTYAQSTCESIGYAPLNDVPLGSIAEVNYELSNTAIYTAIYNKVLWNNFYLNGKILTLSKSTISTVSLIKSYCKNQNECSLTKLVEKVMELTGGTNRQYALEAAYDVMIRVDMDQFIAERFVHFDVDSIDSVLDELIGDSFNSIRSVTTFALFPFCGQSWNYYLLESYCYRFSKKYRLNIMNFNDKNAGIISQKTCNMTYKEMLSVAASCADIELTSESVGAYLFSNGYTAKRKYSDMDGIVERAKELRERKN